MAGMRVSLRKSLRRRLLARDGNICHYCEEEMAPAGQIGNPMTCTLEHIVPQSYGGSDEIHNLVLACAECNESRGNDLDFCVCDKCLRVMDNYFNKKFNSLMNANKYRIAQKNGRWHVHHTGKTHIFKTWAEAIAFTEGK